jgi:hypothetical protein
MSNIKYDNIRFNNTSMGKIKKIIKNLPWKNSQCYDEIPIKPLTISAPFIISPLCHIINKSLSTCISQIE